MIQVAMLWLMDEKGNLLLARRADHKAQDPGLWGPSVTGKLEAGETYRAAAIREAEEELDLKPSLYPLTFLFETTFDHPDGEQRVFHVFVAHVPRTTSESLRIDTNEVAEIKWVSIDEIRKLLQSKPGEQVVASAFVLWEQIFAALDASDKKDL